jgi:hypothetical protein
VLTASPGDAMQRNAHIGSIGTVLTLCISRVTIMIVVKSSLNYLLNVLIIN